MMSLNVKLILFILCPMVICIFIFGWFEMQILGMILGIVIGVIGYLIVDKLQDNTRKKHKGELELNLDKWQISVSARNKYIVDYISIQAEHTGSFGYAPPEVSYTSVTIGGVTTGSVNYNDESLTVSSMKRTGKYYLNFGTKDDYRPIYYIKLSDSLVIQAKQNPDISRYLVENTLVLWDNSNHLDELERNAVAGYLSDGSLESYSKASKILGDRSRSLLSYNDCAKIKNWLKGKD